MFKAKGRGRKSEPKEVPQWKQLLEAEERGDSTGPSRSTGGAAASSKHASEEPSSADASAKRQKTEAADGARGQAQGTAVREEETDRKGSARAVADAESEQWQRRADSPEARGAAGASGSHVDVDAVHDDDDDDDVDLSHYKLDDDDEEEDTDAGPPPAHAPSRVLVTNLAFESTAASIEKFFEGCGSILRIDMPFVNRYERAAHVSFASQGEALNAVLKTGSKLDGRRLVVVLQAAEEASAQRGGPAHSKDDEMAVYGYKSAGRGNRYYGTVFADDDARSREKLQRREDKRSGRMGLGQPTGFPQFL